MKVESYLHNIPVYEKTYIFGVNWMIRLWKASILDVWCLGDSMAMSLMRYLLLTTSSSFTADREPEETNAHIN